MILIAAGGLIVLVAMDLFPLIQSLLLHADNETLMASSLHRSSLRSYLAMITLQALQVLSMFLPTVPIQVAAGMAFGIERGLLVCLAGDALGNTIIFVLMRRLRRIFGAIDPSENNAQCLPEPGTDPSGPAACPADAVLPAAQGVTAESVPPAAPGVTADRMPGGEADQPEAEKRRRRRASWNFSFILKSKNPALLAFLLFLIPGVPNGILPYVFARTKITLPRYLLSVVTAMTPNILVSSVVGDLLSDGDVRSALIIAGATLAVTLLVLLRRRQFTAFLNRYAHHGEGTGRQEGAGHG